VLLCEIVEGRYRSQEVLIPRITHHCNDSRLPFTLCRRQFPVTGAFAMTINKSQGQSYDRVGIYLRNEVFSHGQLYVALSRGRHPANIKVANDNNEAVGTVKNIVYHEVFT
jgi:ATP-dependent DNA helicase PIF1